VAKAELRYPGTIERTEFMRFWAGLLQPELGYNLVRVVDSLGRTSRYSTATSRPVYRTIEELERVRAARKAREESAASMDAEPAEQPAELNEGRPERQGENPASSDSRAFVDVGKVEAA
jgi:hypothetical protein